MAGSITGSERGATCAVASTGKGLSLCALLSHCLVEEPRIDTAVTRSSYHTPVKQMFMLLTEWWYESVCLVPSGPLTGHSLHASYSVPTG